MSSAVFGKRIDFSSAPPAAPFIPCDLVRGELQRILSSRVFQHAKNDRGFLEYTVAQTLAGCADQIKEYSLGTEVFHRGENFDPRLDPIVRIQARSLRARLAQYYETEGRLDPIEIGLPKGTYVPVFTSREPAKEETEAGPSLPEDAAATLSGADNKEKVGLTQGQHPQGDAQADVAEVRTGNRDALRLWKIGAIVAMLFCAALVCGYFFRIHYPQPASVVDTPSIAILPFKNQSDDKADEFFSDGLTDELIDSFARLPGMRVVARTSVNQYKGNSIDVRKMARELNVRNVLEGSVRRYGDRIRITAELEDAGSGYTVWSQTYDRGVQDALGIQREISSLIANTLGLKLAPLTFTSANLSLNSTSLDDSEGVSPEAYEDYLRGRYFFDRNSAQAVKAAISYFQQAIAKAPQFAPAYMGLAHCYVQEATSISSVSAKETIPLAIAAADKAVALDPSLGEARLDLALASEFTYNWTEAGSQFQKALELSPGDSLIHRVYSVYLLHRDLPEKALEEAKIAAQLDPISSTASADLGRALNFNGRFDEALEQYRIALELEPISGMAHLGLAEAYIGRGMYPKGLAELQDAERFLGGGHSARLLALRGYAYGRSGQLEKARQILSMFDEESRVSAQPFPETYRGYLYIGLGDHDNAFKCLQKAAMQRETDLLFLNVSPLYSPHRSDPRFSQLQAQLYP